MLVNQRWPGMCVLCVAAAFATPGCGEADRPAAVRAPATGPAAAVAGGAVKGWDCAALLNTQEVDSFVGRAGAQLVSHVRGDTNREVPGHTECGYQLPPAGGLHFYVNTGPAVGPASGYDLRGSALRNNAEKLSGIGDEAWMWDLKGNSFSAFAVAKGAEVFVGVGNEGGRGKEIARRVLEIVVSRL
jgi:hypothetical protein